MPRTSLEEVRRLLLAQDWIFAKTMPENPHEYTLRGRWASDEDFIRVVQFIRAHGYPSIYQGRRYIQLDVDEHFYWTMGDSLPRTILINRKLLPAPASLAGPDDLDDADVPF